MNRRALRKRFQAIWKWPSILSFQSGCYEDSATPSAPVKEELFNMTRARDKQISESPTGIEPMTSRTHGGRSIHLATRTHGEQGFSLSHARVMLINSPSTFITELKIHHLYSPT